MGKRYFIVLMQVVLLVSMSFSFSYLFGDILSLASAVEGDLVFEDGYVEEDLILDEADEPYKPVDLSGIWSVLWQQGGGDIQSIIDGITGSSGDGVSICTVNKGGSLCQMYTEKECDINCAGNCVRITTLSDGTIADVPDECKLGVCLDEEFGTCEPNSPKGDCEEKEGEWLTANSNDARCRKGCCLLGDQGLFVTSQQCKVNAVSRGLEFGEGGAFFDEGIVDELSCLIQADVNADSKGACTFLRGDDLNDCQFTTLVACVGVGGNFNEGLLCSHESLGSVCEKKNHTECVEELNSVYWFDSCGNMENIFDADAEDDGWNGGEILTREEVCSVSSSSGVVGNQEDCGNCNYAGGSKCEEETFDEELDDNPDGNVVCKDLGCEWE
ncbi:MAG: hypothetical protein ABIH92_04360, partial [Nanoarchaeota archaeon]